MGFKESKSVNKVFILISFAIIGYLVAMRDTSVGADTSNYYRMYIRLGYEDLSGEDLEAGFVFLMRQLRKISEEPQTLFICQGIFVGITYTYFVSKNTKTLHEAYLAILCFLAFNQFSFHLSGVRQSFAMCICLFAYQIMKPDSGKPKSEFKRFIQFLLVVLLATQFHTSALLFIPAYFVVRVKEQTAIIGAIVVAVLGMFFTEPIIDFLFSWNERYDKYSVEETGNGYIFVAVMTLVLVFYFVYKNNIYKDNKGLTPHARLCMIDYSLWLIRLVTRTIERVSFYYTPSTMILIANTTRAYEKDNERYFYTFLLSVLLIILFFYRIGTFEYSFC